RTVLCLVFPQPSTHALYTLSLHDALPIFDNPDRYRERRWGSGPIRRDQERPGRSVLVHIDRDHALVRRDLERLHVPVRLEDDAADRKSTRLNSSHVKISYAVFCLKKKRKS